MYVDGGINNLLCCTAVRSMNLTKVDGAIYCRDVARVFFIMLNQGYKTGLTFCAANTKLRSLAVGD